MPEMNEKNHNEWMERALELACKAEALGEVPVGAVVVCNNEIIGEGYNQPISTNDPSAHAEIVAMRDAANRLNNYRLIECCLYVTLEPCAMCAGAMVHARINQLVFGASEPRAGAIVSQLALFDEGHFNHQPPYIGGVLEAECGDLISSFFRRKRGKRALKLS